MNAALIFALIAVACALAAVFATTRSRGPRVTHIETRTHEDTQGDR